MTQRSNQLIAIPAPSATVTEGAEATPENQAVAKVTPANHRLELLGLPSELRILIFRHLLVYPWSFEIGGSPSGRLPPVAILRTNRLIHTEASNVLYRENEFANFLPSGPVPSFLERFPQLANTMQNIHIDVATRHILSRLRGFIENMEAFTGSSIIRNTLSILFIHHRLDHSGIINVD
ncbi:hypothetical protein MMC07_005756 [Pseudocyphellaria aurata]|nr:hypothetical protein [Pseudocyphellaria aurata]